MLWLAPTAVFALLGFSATNETEIIVALIGLLSSTVAAGHGFGNRRKLKQQEERLKELEEIAQARRIVVVKRPRAPGDRRRPMVIVNDEEVEELWDERERKPEQPGAAERPGGGGDAEP